MISLNTFFKNKNLHESSLFKIINDISNGAKIVNEVLLNGNPKNLKSENVKNIQNEDVQKLDLIANNVFLDYFKNNQEIQGILSEENENIIEGNTLGKYLIAMDPLDGSSNISVNIPVGSIFSIYQKKDMSVSLCENDFLIKGKEQECATYVLYGTSTILIIALNDEVHGFTLNLKEGEYFLTFPDIKIPEYGNIFSINEGNIKSVDTEIFNYIEYCKELDLNGKRTHTGRFIGSLVADFHRNMMKGGIFIYPKTSDRPTGQLRLIYECNPIALIAKFAGSKSSDGNISILEKKPKSIHERTAFITGSNKMVDKLLSFYKNE
mgnify:CR=1 FL=1